MIAPRLVKFTVTSSSRFGKKRGESFTLPVDDPRCEALKREFGLTWTTIVGFQKGDGPAPANVLDDKVVGVHARMTRALVEIRSAVAALPNAERAQLVRRLQAPEHRGPLSDLVHEVFGVLDVEDAEEVLVVDPDADTEPEPEPEPEPRAPVRKIVENTRYRGLVSLVVAVESVESGAKEPSRDELLAAAEKVGIDLGPKAKFLSKLKAAEQIRAALVRLGVQFTTQPDPSALE